MLSQPNAVHTEEELELFTTAALDSESLLKHLSSWKGVFDERHFWFDAIQNGKDDISLAILLPHLPNLVAVYVGNRPGWIE